MEAQGWSKIGLFSFVVEFVNGYMMGGGGRKTVAPKYQE